MPEEVLARWQLGARSLIGSRVASGVIVVSSSAETAGTSFSCRSIGCGDSST